MVNILLSFPIMGDGCICYLSVPLGYQLWNKKQTQMEIAAKMMRHAMDSISLLRQVFLLCDNWYPEGYVADLVNEYHNLDIICNARINTAMYDLPPECNCTSDSLQAHRKPVLVSGNKFNPV